MPRTYTFTLTLTTEDPAVIAKLDEPGVTQQLGDALAGMLPWFVRDQMAPWSVVL